MTQPTPVFYVLHGDDEFTLRAEIRSMRARMDGSGIGDLNTTFLDGKTASVSEVLAAASALPFLADKRLVIVEGMLSWLERKGGGKNAKTELEALAAGLSALPETARLVFFELERLRNTNLILKLATQAGSRGYVRDCSPPRDPHDRTQTRWDSGWYARWISKRVEFYGGQIEPRAAAALVAALDQDLYAADSECAKLVDYVGPGQTITEADVATMTAYVPEANIFEIVDALGQGNGAQAAALIHRLLDDPRQQPLGLLLMINRQFRLLIQIRESMDIGSNPNDIPDLQGKSFLVRKLTEQARRFTLAQLEAIYRDLLEIDHAIKTGRISDTLALDLLVADLSA